jgi:hypothetical protein
MTDQHYALIITPLFIVQAATCFGIHMPSSRMSSAGQHNTRHYNNQCTQPPTFTVHDYNIAIAAFQVNQKLPEDGT